VLLENAAQSSTTEDNMEFFCGLQLVYTSVNLQPSVL